MHTSSSESPTIRRHISPLDNISASNSATVETSTLGATIYRFEASVDFPVIPPDYADLNDLVGRYEGDPRKKKALQLARGRFAHVLHAKGEKTLASLRLQKGFSQSKLAQLIGTSQSRLSQYENGGEMMHSAFEKLVIALNIGRDELANALKTSTKNSPNE